MKAIFGVMFLILGGLCMLYLRSMYIEYNFLINDTTSFIMYNAKVVALTLFFIVTGIIIIFKQERK